MAIVNFNLNDVENSTDKDATGGYAGLTLFKINFKNALNTFTSFFTNSNTAARTYTFQDRNGVIADDTDLAEKQDKLYIYKESTPSTPVTGTLTETQIYEVTIPANTFAANDKFVIDDIICSKTGTASFAVITFKLSTSPTMPIGLATDRIAAPGFAASQLSMIANRVFNINGGGILGFSENNSAASAYSAIASTLSTQPFDPTITNYLYVSVLLGNISDSVIVHGFTLKNF